MRKKRKKYNRAFSLLEILLYVAILSVVIISITQIFNTMITANIKNQAINEVSQQGTQTMNIILQTIRIATAINSPAIGVSAASASFNVPTGANSPTQFALTSGTINITEGSGSATAITSNRVTASALSFQNLSRTGTDGSVRVTFTLSYVNPDNRAEKNYSETFYGTATLR